MPLDICHPTAPHAKLKLPEWYVSSLMMDRALDAVTRRVKKFDRQHDIPYLAGYSNDGKTIYKLVVKDVPVDGFWSISVYDDQGHFVPNPQNAYSLNSVTAKPGDDGSFAVQFGGCDGKILNCLPTPPGWNYLVRLYRPRPEILNGAWTFPEARAAQ